MKKIVSVLLTFVMIFSVSSGAFASEEVSGTEKCNTVYEGIDDISLFGGHVIKVKVSEETKTYNHKFLKPWHAYYVKTKYHKISLLQAETCSVTLSHNGLSFTKSVVLQKGYSTTLSANPNRYSRPSIYGDLKVKYTTYVNKTSTGTILSRWTEADIVQKNLYVDVQYK